MLLEWRLALDLGANGLLEKIYPIIIGDADEQGVYKNYFASGCHPNLDHQAKVIVQSVEDKLHHHLENESLGSPMLSPLSVKEIVDAILINQGKLVEGPKDCVFNEATRQIQDMTKESKAGSAASQRTLARRNSIISQRTVGHSPSKLPVLSERF